MWAAMVTVVLAIPFLLKFPWTLGDYIFAGVVLFGSATVYELAIRNVKNKNHRYAIGIAVAMVVILIWGWAVA